MRIIAELGGVNERGVTRRTNVLILGNEEYRRRVGGSRKHRKAEELVLAGQDIEMIPENVFYDLVDFSNDQRIYGFCHLHNPILHQ